jgi:hypothetical protein
MLYELVPLPKRSLAKIDPELLLRSPVLTTAETCATRYLQAYIRNAYLYRYRSAACFPYFQLKTKH